MEQQRFLELFETFSGSSIPFDENEWDRAISGWNEFYNLIVSTEGLPLDRWLNETPGQDLLYFVCVKEKFFGSATVRGGYDNIMIYYHKGDGPRGGKYVDIYTAPYQFDNKSEIESDYQNKIQKLLKDIAKKETLNDIFALENSDDYSAFKRDHVLRKVAVLSSLREESPLFNKFMWIYDEDKVELLADLFDVEKSGKTPLQINNEVYEKAKSMIGLTGTISALSSPQEKRALKEKTTQLYRFLWDLTLDSANLADFNSLNTIYHGAPGTGKSYGVRTGIQKLRLQDEKKYKEPVFIQFHPAFSYQDFIEGFKPAGIESGHLKLKVMNGSFKQLCIDVKKENEVFFNSLPSTNKPDEKKPEDFKNWPHYYFVVDEINRGALSHIFGETFTLLEKDYRDYNFSGHYDTDVDKGTVIQTALSHVISTLEDKEKTELAYKIIKDKVYFGIPFNIHFIGMMNDVDKSIDPFDLALRRRFKWIATECDYDVIRRVLLSKGYGKDPVEKYVESCQKLNESIEKGSLNLGSLYQIGHSFFLKITEYVSKKKKDWSEGKEALFDTYISGTVEEYIRQAKDEETVGELLSTVKSAFGIGD